MTIFKKINILPVVLLHFALFTFVNNVDASQLPHFLGTEKKFRSYVYNPNEVYRYLGHYTYQGFIEFGKDEKISTITMGDPSLWLFEHLSNRLFLKPVGEGSSETNMTVITDKRIYHFELTAKEARSIDDQDLIFVAKFAYPDDKDKNILQFPRSLASDEPDLRDLSKYNFQYQYTGETSITPLKVFDNGEFTYFQFSHKSAEVPAIFSVDSQGYESLVNFRAAGDYIIVEKVAQQFTLRNGSDIVCVYNSGAINSGMRSEPSARRPPSVPNFAGSSTFSPQSRSPQNFAPPQDNGFFGAPRNEQSLSYPGAPTRSGPAFSSPQASFPQLGPRKSGVARRSRAQEQQNFNTGQPSQEFFRSTSNNVRGAENNEAFLEGLLGGEKTGVQTFSGRRAGGSGGQQPSAGQQINRAPVASGADQQAGGGANPFQPGSFEPPYPGAPPRF